MSATVPYTGDLLSRRPCLDEPGHDRRDRQTSGVLICELTTLEPLCIHSIFRSLTDSDKPWIPGSSLRGMTRNVCEILGASCLRLVDRPGPRHPPAIRACNKDAACLTCRMFGFVDADFGWASKVLFTDAQPVNTGWVHCDLVRSYTGRADESLAWAVFAKNQNPAPSIAAARRTTRCAAPGSTFRFRVDYLNLDSEELAVLLFALTLEWDGQRACHKLGYAKALGLGACSVAIKNQIPPVPDASKLAPYLATPAFDEFCKLRGMS